jgi:hypothetical protein
MQLQLTTCDTFVALEFFEAAGQNTLEAVTDDYEAGLCTTWNPQYTGLAVHGTAS